MGLCNVDAGGSAQLMVQGAVVNKTTEGTPRAVANGWMVYSTAPEEDAATITSIAFLDPAIRVPVYSSCKTDCARLQTNTANSSVRTSRALRLQ